MRFCLNFLVRFEFFFAKPTCDCCLSYLSTIKHRLFDWRPDKMRGERGKHERTVIVKNLFSPEVFDEAVHLILEYQNDLRDECAKCGTVRRVLIYDVSWQFCLSFWQGGIFRGCFISHLNLYLNFLAAHRRGGPSHDGGSRRSGSGGETPAQRHFWTAETDGWDVGWQNEIQVSLVLLGAI